MFEEIRLYFTNESKKYKKNWYQLNKERIKQKYEDNKQERLKQMHKYYINNKEKIKEYNKNYYLKNKNKIQIEC